MLYSRRPHGGCQESALKPPRLKRGRSTDLNEPAREILAQQRAIGGGGVYDRDRRLFCDLMLSRAIADFDRMGGAQTPVFFDRGIPDQIGYAELFGLETSMAESAAAVHRYNDVVFALPSWPEIYVTDSERTMTCESAQAFAERVRRAQGLAPVVSVSNHVVAFSQQMTLQCDDYLRGIHVS
jgi:predicted ATPase